jgi:hypothetical protein
MWAMKKQDVDKWNCKKHGEYAKNQTQKKEFGVSLRDAVCLFLCDFGVHGTLLGFMLTGGIV